MVRELKRTEKKNPSNVVSKLAVPTATLVLWYFTVLNWRIRHYHPNTEILNSSKIHSIEVNGAAKFMKLNKKKESFTPFE